MELTDGRTRLRTPPAADASAVADAVRANLDHLRPWMPWATTAYDHDQALLWIGGEVNPNEESFLIVDGHDAPIGACGIHRDEANRIGEIGYWLAADAGGRGHATAATRLLLDRGFEQHGYQRLQIVMSVENEPSRRVAERVGAHHEGVLRRRLLLDGRHHDAHMYSLLPDDPRS